jgi:hypothetical protein
MTFYFPLLRLGQKPLSLAQKSRGGTQVRVIDQDGLPIARSACAFTPSLGAFMPLETNM